MAEWLIHLRGVNSSTTTFWTGLFPIAGCLVSFCHTCFSMGVLGMQVSIYICTYSHFSIQPSVHPSLTTLTSTLASILVTTLATTLVTTVNEVFKLQNFSQFYFTDCFISLSTPLVLVFTFQQAGPQSSFCYYLYYYI